VKRKPLQILTKRKKEKATQSVSSQVLWCLADEWLIRDGYTIPSDNPKQVFLVNNE